MGGEFQDGKKEEGKMKGKIVALVAVLMVVAVFGYGYAEEWKEYQVKKGDTLSEIAFALKIDRRNLIEWNSTGTRIFPGQILRYQIPQGTAERVAERVKEELRKAKEEIKREVRENEMTSSFEVSQAVKEGARKNERKTEEEANEIKKEIWKMRDDLNKTNSSISPAPLTMAIIAGILLISFPLGLAIKSRLTKKKFVEFDVNGLRYRYFPKLNWKGRYVSPFKGATYGKIDDLRKSARSALKKDSALMGVEKTKGRLKEI